MRVGREIHADKSDTPGTRLVPATVGFHARGIANHSEMMTVRGASGHPNGFAMGNVG